MTKKPHDDLYFGIAKGITDAYKKGFDEGWKQGYSQGKIDAYKETMEGLDKILEKMK